MTSKYFAVYVVCSVVKGDVLDIAERVGLRAYRKYWPVDAGP